MSSEKQQLGTPPPPTPADESGSTLLAWGGGAPPPVEEGTADTLLSPVPAADAATLPGAPTAQTPGRATGPAEEDPAAQTIHDPTLQFGTDPGADPTLAAAAVQSTLAATPGSPPAALSAGPSGPHVTVLPRIRLVGARAELQAETRPRYEPLDRLGMGGVGEVIVARDHDIGRKVALKRLRADVRSQLALVRFVEEIRTTGRLEHPNIVPIHDVGIDEEGNYYFVMKYVAGETLETVISRLAAGDPRCHAEYTFERRLQVFVGVLEALAFAHAGGIIHRDIKPANIMIGSFGEVLLMDWGIAKQIRDGEASPLDSLVLRGAEEPREPAGADSGRVFETQYGTVIGTPAYMSPEQARGEPADERSDIYSLCVLLHELLGLRHYLAHRRGVKDTLEGVLQDPAPLLSFARAPHQPTVPMDLTWLVRQGLEKDPSRRYQTVDSLLRRIELRTEGKIPVQCHLTLLKRVNNELSRFMDKHPMFVTASLVATAALAVASLVF